MDAVQARLLKKPKMGSARRGKVQVGTNVEEVGCNVRRRRQRNDRGRG